MFRKMERKRLFIAIDISEEVRAAIEGHVNALKGFQNKSVRWEKPEKIHLTLKFLGDTAVAKVPQIGALLSEAASNRHCFDLTAQGTGVFPSQDKARVLWIGLNRIEPLEQLHADIENRLESIDIPKEDRRFSPHLTIARIRDARQAKPVIEQHIALEFGPVRLSVNEITLYESKLLRSGSVYSAIEKYPLENL
jgi:2'-5' RNA ligase